MEDENVGPSAVQSEASEDWNTFIRNEIEHFLAQYQALKIAVSGA